MPGWLAEQSADTAGGAVVTWEVAQDESVRGEFDSIERKPFPLTSGLEKHDQGPGVPAQTAREGLTRSLFFVRCAADGAGTEESVVHRLASGLDVTEKEVKQFGES
jgi:hypothetical protein